MQIVIATSMSGDRDTYLYDDDGNLVDLISENKHGDRVFLSDTWAKMLQFFKDNSHRVDELAAQARKESN